MEPEAARLTLGPNPVHMDLAAEPHTQEKVDKWATKGFLQAGGGATLLPVLTRPVGRSCLHAAMRPGPGCQGQIPLGLVLQG